MKNCQVNQVVNGFTVREFNGRVHVFETFQGLCGHLAVEFEVLLEAEEDPATTKIPPDMDIAELGPKYAKADCCDYSKKVPCAFRMPFKDPSVPNSETKDMCSHGSLACKENKEVFEAINKPCHGGYKPQTRKAKRNQVQWVSVSHLDILRFMKGRGRIDLPGDAEIICVKDGKQIGIIHFLVRSAEYRELSIGSEISGDCMPTEQVVPISIDTANILKALLVWFKGAIKAGKIADPENYTDRLTVEYCDELKKELSNVE